MSIDKFGRRSFSNSKAMRGPKGEGFKLTPLGHYDIENKKLSNLSDPTELLDAVNLSTLNKAQIKSLTIDNNNICSAKDAIIANIASPKNDGDAVNLKYLHNYSLVRHKKEFNAKNNRIVNLSDPLTSNDAVNYKYLINHLSELAYAIYNQLHKNSRKKVDITDWNNKIAKGNFKWDELFSLENLDEQVNPTSLKQN